MDSNVNSEKFVSIISEAQKLYQKNTDLKDRIVANIFKRAEKIAATTVTKPLKSKNWDHKIDNLLTSKVFGYPIMLLLLGLIFWLTVEGANYPSQLMATGLFWIEEQLTGLFLTLNVPQWIHGVLILGMYRTFAWVVSVMLPPMAIFFPLFTLLEDLGYLPRVAFNLDKFFKKAGAHGKQSLTMSMGFGCNAAGIIACRIIESPRERMIAILTNNFVPCNGRFPTLIIIASVFMGSLVVSTYSSLAATTVVVGLVLAGIGVTLLVSWILSKTILKGVPSSFTLELPPYRKPQIGQVLIRSLLDRTIFVLGRAVIIALPAGVITWILANVNLGDISILAYLANLLDPFAQMIGLDGIILMAFILGLPANEIVLPILFMSYLAEGAMLEIDSLVAIRQLLVANGWTWLTALNLMLFSLLHFPCGTTLWTIKKETQSNKWPIVAGLITTASAIIVCFATTQIVRLLGIL